MTMTITSFMTTIDVFCAMFREIIIISDFPFSKKFSKGRLTHSLVHIGRTADLWVENRAATGYDTDVIWRVTLSGRGIDADAADVADVVVRGSAVCVV